MTVGPDEFRGPAPDHKRGLFRPRQATGSADPGPTAHAILDYRPRSPWKPFRGGPTRPRLRSGRPALPKPPSPRRRAVVLLAAQQRPGDPRQLVRDRGHHDVLRPPRQQAVDPRPQTALPTLADRHQRPGAVHELAAQVAVAALADPEEAFLAAARVLPGHE